MGRHVDPATVTPSATTQRQAAAVAEWRAEHRAERRERSKWQWQLGQALDWIASHPEQTIEMSGDHRPVEHKPVELFPFTSYGVLIEEDDGGLWVSLDDGTPYWIGPRAISALRSLFARMDDDEEVV